MKSVSVNELTTLGSDVSIIDVRTAHVMCASGGRSFCATEHLAREGYDAADVVDGSTQWHHDDHPVTYCT
ncbi:rhodanese-like domain-containing protein [Arthrobacter sp. H14-L1]|uniref:rhodanese-like domain-containing protein n=1 Tax=Arthrobacter sp. H14-L1 TaxID=2996697 RepID=UPI00226DC956|nr:hypothetical protein [Arthrobacter sp. H14-L1]MCY0905824.1 hypothetical protein [Arthrobacter sp. H14-L1]